MSVLIDSVLGRDKRTWRQFLLLLVLFLVDMKLCCCLPTPGSWSDGRSQWLPQAAAAVTAICLCIAVHWVYRRQGFIFKIQAVMLWLLFGTVMAGSAYGVYDSLTFLREVRVHDIQQNAR